MRRCCDVYEPAYRQNAAPGKCLTPAGRTSSVSHLQAREDKRRRRRRVVFTGPSKRGRQQRKKRRMGSRYYRKPVLLLTLLGLPLHGSPLRMYPSGRERPAHIPQERGGAHSRGSTLKRERGEGNGGGGGGRQERNGNRSGVTPCDMQRNPAT